MLRAVLELLDKEWVSNDYEHKFIHSEYGQES